MLIENVVVYMKSTNSYAQKYISSFVIYCEDCCFLYVYYIVYKYFNTLVHVRPSKRRCV